MEAKRFWHRAKLPGGESSTHSWGSSFGFALEIETGFLQGEIKVREFPAKKAIRAKVMDIRGYAGL